MGFRKRGQIFSSEGKRGKDLEINAGWGAGEVYEKIGTGDRDKTHKGNEGRGIAGAFGS